MIIHQVSTTGSIGPGVCVIFDKNNVAPHYNYAENLIHDYSRRDP